MTEYAVNLKICEGVTYTKEAVLAETAAPGNLVKADSKWADPEGGLKGITEAQRKTMEGAIHMCRYWYDETSYGKPFCCQMMEAGTLDADKKYTM